MSTELMSELDFLYYHLGKRDTLNLSTGATCFFTATPDVDHLKKTLEAASWQIPRLRQRASNGVLRAWGAKWVDDEKFDIDNHFRHVHLDEPASHGELLRLSDEFQSRPFKHSLPLWEIWVVTNRDTNSPAAVFVRLHHCVADGVGIRNIFMGIFGDRADAPEASEANTSTLTYGRRTLAGLAGAARDIGSFAAYLINTPERRQLRDRLTRYSWTPNMSRLQQNARTRQSMHYRVPQASWSRQARVNGGNANALFLAFIARVLYEIASPEMRRGFEVVMPITLRTTADAVMGNLTRSAILTLDGDQPLKTLTLGDIRLLVSEGREKAVTRDQPAEERLFRFLPIELQARLRMRSWVRTDAVSTKIPIPKKIVVAGARIDMIFMQTSAIGPPLTFALSTYDGFCNITVNIDVGVMKDVNRLQSVMLSQLREMFGDDVHHLSIAGSGR